jgi:hypothetical protein
MRYKENDDWKRWILTAGPSRGGFRGFRLREGSAGGESMNRPASFSTLTNASAAGTLKQIRSASQWGILGGLALSASSVLLMLLSLIQAILFVDGWGPRLALVVEGLLWSSLIGAAGALVLILSQALRCLYDLTYRGGPPLVDEG